MTEATTPATDAEIAALKAAAERATKGEWVAVHERDRAPEVSVHIPCSDGGSWWIATVYDAAKGVSAADNAAYIALANPATILSLLARLDAAERERDRMAEGWAAQSTRAFSAARRAGAEAMRERAAGEVARQHMRLLAEAPLCACGNGRVPTCGLGHMRRAAEDAIRAGDRGMTREGLIEAMAEALFNDSAGHPRPHVLTWAEMKEVHGLRYEGVARFYSRARAALVALEAHAAVVPREPTQEMMAAGQDALRGTVRPWPVRLLPAFRAMCAASPLAPGGRAHRLKED